MAHKNSRNEKKTDIVERRIANIRDHLIPCLPISSHSHCPPLVGPALASSGGGGGGGSRYRRIHGDVETREAEWRLVPSCKDDDDDDVGYSGKEFTDLIYEKAVGEGIAKVHTTSSIFISKFPN